MKETGTALVMGSVFAVSHSFARAVRRVELGARVVTHPRAMWHLWEWSRGAVAWVLCIEPLVLAWIAVETAQVRWHGADFARFGVLLACALAHAIGTRVSEERRRGAHGNGTHVDQTSIWFFSAALVLPVPLTVLLILVVRTHRWFIARKPFYKYLHTNAAICLSALGVHAVTSGTPLREWLTGQRPLPVGPAEMLGAAGALAAAVAAYFVAQAVLVGAARGLGSRRWDLVDMLGTPRDNVEIGYALLLASCAAVLEALSLPLLIAMVPIAVYSTRSAQRVGELEELNRRLMVDATHDVLTGLPNRRGFSEAAEQQLARAGRSGLPTTLLLLDLDHFKRVNDTMGHLVGDQVLVAFAGAVRDSTRQGDLLCRWGGEEVAVLLPDTGCDNAVIVAERIRVTVEAMRIPVTKAAGGDTVILGVPSDGCTVSIGVAAFPEHGATLVEVATMADEALYQSKRDGRNRVHVARSRRADSLRP
jgi:diguanylate cyclase (GGDEF)-like protein